MNMAKVMTKVVCFIVMVALVFELGNFLTVVPSAYSSRLVYRDLRVKENIDVVVAGTSRVYRGANPEMVRQESGLDVFNLSSMKQSTVGTYYMLREMYRHHAPKLVVLEISWNRLRRNPNLNADRIVFDNYPISLDKFQFLFNAFEPEDYGKTVVASLRSHNKEKIINFDFESISGNVQKKRSPAFRDFDYGDTSIFGEYQGNGFIFGPNYFIEGHKGQPNVINWNRKRVRSVNLEHFEKSIELCRRNGSDVILNILPRPRAQLGSVNNYEDFLDYLDELSKRWNVPVFNFELIRTEIFEGGDSDFKDYNHLSGRGSNRFSQPYADFLTDYVNGTLEPGKYFYSTYQELLDENRGLYTVWLTRDMEDPETFMADWNAGTDVRVEFEFSYGETSDEFNQVLQPYSTSGIVRLDGYESGYLRVRARKAGSDADYEHFDIIAVGSTSAYKRKMGRETR